VRVCVRVGRNSDGAQKDQCITIQATKLNDVSVPLRDIKPPKMETRVYMCTYKCTKNYEFTVCEYSRCIVNSSFKLSHRFIHPCHYHYRL